MISPLFNTVLTVALALDAIFEKLASSESRNFFSRDQDFVASFGIEALTLGALARFEGSKAQNGHFFTFDYGIDNNVDQSINRGSNLHFSQASPYCHLIDEFTLIHDEK